MLINYVIISFALILHHHQYENLIYCIYITLRCIDRYYGINIGNNIIMNSYKSQIIIGIKVIMIGEYPYQLIK